MKQVFFLLAIVAITLLFSCQNSKDKEIPLAALSDTVSVSGLSGEAVKLVKTAALRIKVGNVEQGARAVSTLASSFGGMVYNHQFETVEAERSEQRLSHDSLLVITAFSPQASITARIPSESLEEFIYKATGLGYFTGSSSLHIDDKSLAFLQNALMQKNRTEKLSKHLYSEAKTLTATEDIRISDEVISHQIGNRAIDADVRYSSVELNLFQNKIVQREVVANYDVSSYTLPFGKRLNQAFLSGWQYFLDFLLVLANLWMFILAAIIGYIAFHYFKQIRKLSSFQ